MKLQLNLLKNTEPMFVQYIDDFYVEKATETETYNHHKLVVLLTDDLVAVLENKCIGGKKGDVLLFNPEEIHFGRFLRQRNYRFLEIYIPVSFLEDSFYSYENVKRIFRDNSDTRINCITGTPAEKAEIVKIAEKIILLAMNYTKENDIELFACILEILIMSSKLYDKSKSITWSDIVTPPQVLQSINYISEHYSESISVESIAYECGCSVAYLSRLFKRYFGVSLYNYVLEYRINKAKALLSLDCSVTEVCYLTGFNDCSNFINKFKKMTGITPLQYKKNFIQ